MVTVLKARRSTDAASVGISPIGYYRLGQSYPRERSRQCYPSSRRRVVFEASSTPPAAGASPYYYLLGAN